MLKTVIFLLEVSFTDDFVLDCPFKLCFWQIKLFFLTTKICSVFFRLLDKKLKTNFVNNLKMSKFV